MAPANPNVRAAIAPDIVAPNATNLVFLFALDQIPVSTQRLVCHWHRDAGGRLVCAWEQTYPPIPHPRSERTCQRFVSRNGSNIGSG
jgi:hypothetical protein